MATPGQARWLVAGLAVVLAGPPQLAAAGPPSKVDRKLLDKVSKLGSAAQTRFETADFAGAIELWTQAYAELPAEPAYDKRRNGLVYLIAQASIEAYALDPQLAYLRKAEVLFEQYLTTINPQDKETLDKVQGSLGELRDKIKSAEDKAAVVEQEAAAQKAESERAKRAEAERAAARRKAAEDEARKAGKLQIAGGVLVSLGAASLGVMGYGLASGAKVDREGEAARAEGVTELQVYRDLLAEGMVANRMAIITAALGGALVIVGVALVGAGTAQKRRARRELATTPTWLGGGAGLVLQGRF